MTQAIHWTLNNSTPYNGSEGDRPNMIRRFRESLESFQKSDLLEAPIPARATRRFRLVPNMNRGFTREGDPVYFYHLGALEIGTEPTETGLRYDVRRRHRTAGEHNRWTFETDLQHRLLSDRPWGLDAHSHAVGAYSRYTTSGTRTADGDLRVTLRGGSTISLGKHDDRTDLFTQFSLMAGADLPSIDKLTVLEDLERCKPGCSLRRFDTWTCALTERAMELTGYILEGEGQEPVYFWIDARGVPIFVVNIFTTYVLESVSSTPLPGSPYEPKQTAPATRSRQQRTDATSRPNILFINTDQQHASALGGLGNQHLRTPATDRLLANGLSFERSYCTDPVCCPARSSWITSRYTSENGGIGNAGKVHADLPDLGDCLRECGYRAYHSGKYHFGREVGMVFDLLYDSPKGIGASGGEYFDAPSCRAVMDFLDTDQGEDPWFIQLGIVNPHDFCETLHFHEENAIPNIAPTDAIAPDSLPPLPENFVVNFRETVNQEIAHRTGSKAIINWGIAKEKESWTEDHWRWLAWNYYRYVERADQDIAAVLATLEASPFATNTLILFSADHGEAHGYHQNLQKFSLYEESIRVPFIMAEIGNRFGIPKGQRNSEHFVSGVDLMPTVLDWAGIEPPTSLQGRSLKPFSQGTPPADWPDHVYVENNVYGRALIRGRHKFITEYVPKADDHEQRIPPRMSTHELGRINLFDLETDPLETQDISAQHPDIVEAFISLLRERESTLETRPLHPRIANLIAKVRDASFEQTESVAVA